MTVEMIRGAAREYKALVAKRRVAVLPFQYEEGVVAGLVMALQFMGEITADGALELLKQDQAVGGVA